MTGAIRLFPGERRAREPVAAFLAVTDAIERRDRCGRLEALQRACDEAPAAFDAYCRVMGATLCPAL